MLEQFHARDDVECAWHVTRQRFGLDLAVLNLKPGLEQMQLGDLQRRVAQVDTGHAGASDSHCFREYSAAAADIEHAFSSETSDAVDIIEPQRIDIMQRFEFRAGVPPAMSELVEFVEL